MVRCDMLNCTQCQKELTEANSSESQRARGKGRGMCVSCNREYNKKRRRQQPLAHIIYRAKGNAKIRGIEFNITEKDLPSIPENCPIFPWIKLVYTVGEGRSEGSLSLDRIDSSQGYVKGNLRFVSNRANSMKSDMTDAELRALGTDAEKRVRAGKL